MRIAANHLAVIDNRIVALKALRRNVSNILECCVKHRSLIALFWISSQASRSRRNVHVNGGLRHPQLRDEVVVFHLWNRRLLLLPATRLLPDRWIWAEGHASARSPPPRDVVRIHSAGATSIVTLRPRPDHFRRKTALLVGGRITQILTAT